MKKILTTFAIVALFSAAAFATPTPVAQPSWWGLDDGNTRSSFEGFGTDEIVGDYDYHAGFSGAAGDSWQISGFEWSDDGMWMINNGDSNEGANGYIIVDIANFANPDNSKEVFFEAWYWYEGGYSLSFSVYTDDTSCSVYSLGSGGGFIPGSDESYFFGEREIIPQPEQEYLRMDVYVPAGSSFAVDGLFFGTHCEAIPEPSTIAIMLAGASGLVLAARRKFRK